MDVVELQVDDVLDLAVLAQVAGPGRGLGRRGGSCGRKLRPEEHRACDDRDGPYDDASALHFPSPSDCLGGAWAYPLAAPVGRVGRTRLDLVAKRYRRGTRAYT